MKFTESKPYSLQPCAQVGRENFERMERGEGSGGASTLPK